MLGIKFTSFTVKQGRLQVYQNFYKLFLLINAVINADSEYTSVLKLLGFVSRNISRAVKKGSSSMTTNGTTMFPGQMENETRHSDSAAYQFIHFGETFIIPTIFLIGVITNSISLYVLPLARIVRTFRTCLVALTISDVLSTSLGFSASVMEADVFGGDMPHGHWDSRSAVIYVLYYLQVMFMCTSAAIVIFIVATRHWIVKHPLKARQITTRKTKWILCSLFVLTFVVYIPTCMNIMYQLCYSDHVTPECQEIHRKIPNLENISKYYLYTLTTVYGPILIMVYIGCLIGIRATLRASEEVIRKLTTESQALVHSESSRSAGASTPATRMQSTTKITRTLVMIVILDTICTLPTVVQGLAQVISPTTTVFSTTNTAFQVFDVISEIFLAMRPAYNFWLYVFTHDEFITAFETRFHCKYSHRFIRALPCYNKSERERDINRNTGNYSHSGSGDKSLPTITTQI